MIESQSGLVWLAAHTAALTAVVDAAKGKDTDASGVIMGDATGSSGSQTGGIRSGSDSAWPRPAPCVI